MSDSTENSFPDRVVFKDRSGAVRFFVTATAKQHWCCDRTAFSDVILSWLADGSWVQWERDRVSDSEIRDAAMISETRAIQLLIIHGLEPPDCAALQALQFGADGTKQDLIEVTDEDTQAFVMFDPSGCQVWTSPNPSIREWDSIEEIPLLIPLKEYESLYLHPNGRWFLLIGDQHRLRTRIRRLSEEKAAHWLFWEKFDVPAELHCFVRGLEFDVNAERSKRNGAADGNVSASTPPETSTETTNDTTLVLDALQMRILEVLDGKALRAQALADKCGVAKNKLYIKRANGTQPLPELVDHGRVAKDRKIGFYRPDVPPPSVSGRRTHTST